MNSLKRQFSNLSIKYKFISGISVILVTAMLLLSVIFIQQSEKLLLKDLEDKAFLVNRNFSIVSEKSIQESSFSNLQELINEVTANDEDINVLLVGYANTLVIATSDQKNYEQFSKIRDPYILQQLEKKANGIVRDRKRDVLKSIRMIYGKYNLADERLGQSTELLGFIPIRYQKLINPVKCCKRFNGIFILSEFI